MEGQHLVPMISQWHVPMINNHRFIKLLKKVRTHDSYHGAGILFWTIDGQGQPFVLLGKRKYNPQRGYWSIPGGGWDEADSFVEKGQLDYRETALRESREEIGFAVDNPEKLAYLWSRHLPFFHFVVYAHQLSGKREVVRYQEFSQVKWFPTDSLPTQCVWFLRSQVAALVRQHHEGEKWHGKDVSTRVHQEGTQGHHTPREGHPR